MYYPLLAAFCALCLFSTLRAQDPTSVVSNRPISCELTTSDSRDCNACVAKGSSCFWCSESSRCLPYEWYFPGCSVSEVKYKSCWVNWSAVAIVCAVLAGILIVVILGCVCYCCCKCSAAKRARAEKLGARREAKNALKLAEMHNKQEDRRSARDKEMDKYREKYGIPKKTLDSPPSK